MLLDFADLTLTDKGSLYRELYAYIKKGVEGKVLKKGEKLPSVREAAAQLGVSRTTVENAYIRLCIEGFCESRPQRGYYIIGAPDKVSKMPEAEKATPEIRFDFSSRSVDAAVSDIGVWKRLVRSVLWNEEELNTYGDPQGEITLRQALADYAYKARGVICSYENIVIGAGMGPLLNILCGLLGRDLSVGFENGGFKEARKIFCDYGMENFDLSSDNSGARIKELESKNPDILFLLPSALGKISPTELAKRRNGFENWARQGKKLIIEDDYNGELRYTARSIPAFQGRSQQNTVYIGSFSKLLLPSVRIAYMVLPDLLAEKFKATAKFYNQTCGKIEQLALEKYIVSGALEKHLKKLRRHYAAKSQILSRALRENLSGLKSLTLYESSLMIEVETDLAFDRQRFLRLAAQNGIRTAAVKDSTHLSLCFAGTPQESLTDGVKALEGIMSNLDIRY